MNDKIDDGGQAFPKICLLSGGRTSGFMTRRLLDLDPNYRSEFLTIFCNTGKERTQTLDFVHEMETRWNLPVIWLEYTRVPAASIPPGIFPTDRRNQNLAKAAAAGEFAHWFKKVDYETASRNGEPFDELLGWATVLPNQGARICSTQTKIRTAMRYLFSVGVHHYSPHIGIRKDEEKRTFEIMLSVDSFEHPVFPMVEWNLTEHDVMRFWKTESDFDLQLQSYEGNCDLCFLKAKYKRVRIAREHPELLKWWLDWEAKKEKQCAGDGKYFRINESFAHIKELSEQADLFNYADQTDQDIPCSCAERAFGGTAEEKDAA